MTTRTHLQAVAGLLVAIGVLIVVGAAKFNTWVPLLWVLVAAVGAWATLRAQPWAKWLVYLSAYVCIAGYFGGTLAIQRRWLAIQTSTVGSVAWFAGAAVVLAAVAYCCYVATVHLRTRTE